MNLESRGPSLAFSYRACHMCCSNRDLVRVGDKRTTVGRSRFGVSDATKPNASKYLIKDNLIFVQARRLKDIYGLRDVLIE